jgi:serine/threonine protein kinase
VLVDRFRLDTLIGTGGMATVYKATDLALGRTVALKLFRMDVTDDSGPERQSGEVMVLASLNHFALVTLFDAGTEHVDDHTRSFIVMEYIDGADLRSRISTGRLAPADVAAMGADLAEALHYVHAKGIIHRDIKPANVLLAPSDFPGRVAHAKLADFGIARLFDATHLTRTGAVLGTAGYLSPEQALGHAIGPPSDVYSLGLVLLESLTAERCYPGTAIESAMARLQRQPEIPDWLGTGWRSVLEGMTARDPDARMGSADAAVRLRELVPAGSTAAHIADAAGTPDEPTRAFSSVPDEATRILSAAPSDDAQTEQMAQSRQAVPTASTEQLGRTTWMEQPEPTRRDAQTAARLSQSPPPAARRRAPMVIAAVIVALLAVAAVLFLVQPNDTLPAGPDYPAVEGELGEHLNQLQESVNP